MLGNPPGFQSNKGINSYKRHRQVCGTGMGTLKVLRRMEFYGKIRKKNYTKRKEM